MRLIDKVAALTGAGGGIGQAIARKLVAEGARVLATDLSSDALSPLEAELGERVASLAVDVSDYTAVEAMMEAAVSRFGTLDIVLNNAGIGFPRSLLEHDPVKDFDRVTAVNQKGVYHGILAGGRRLVALGRRGVIINTSSVYGTMASEMSFTYNTSKAAVDMMTRCAALELAPHNIRVCAVAPGRVHTPLLEQYKELGLWEHIRRESMRQTFTRPEEIADVVAFLASDEANCINGTTVDASDGFTQFKYPLTQC